ncbi:thiamine biosynthesis protein ThiF [Lysobacter sp. TAF61]|uniref:ThiF family adenylyltransferase n=1 Tax=Lysobacter sp. TAF61 TaxID=3233072 RepID=UPI003F9AA217
MDADSLHRLTKVLLDSGEASSLSEAQATFSAYGVRVIIGQNALEDATHRVIAMTALNIAARTFEGNVLVEGDLDAIVDVELEQTLGEFLDWLGITKTEASASWPTIVIGTAPTGVAGVMPWASGWRFGLGRAPVARKLFAPAAVAAGALAVNEAFSLLRNDNPYAGRRQLELSLWEPQHPHADGPEDAGPIPNLWIVGLGHLGQAYAWTLGLMEHQSSCELYIQDVDQITASSVSTSVLTSAGNIQHKKTRVVAQWLEARGYKTSIVERRFDENQRVGMNEPRIALFGVDNSATRRHIESGGFRFAIDAGLGAGYQDFKGIRVRTFPGPSQAADLWAATTPPENKPLAPAYEDLLAHGADACGVARLASRAVGAPFVGCVAAAYVIAELVRSTTGGPRHGYVDLNLREPDKVECDTSGAGL